MINEWLNELSDGCLIEVFSEWFLNEVTVV